ncbi:30S ribosomal protein S13 [bacterium]|nr:30S ribosomal protein S13 [bacterium]|tara:strand:+ start:77 stop:469 length:393 start_codon:yes stop_codon:yes gene_type:complete
MAIRISGINLPDKKRIVIALTEIYGIGQSLSAKILGELKIDENTKANELTSTEENNLRGYIEDKLTVEGELKREVSFNIKHHQDVGTYRGTRHSKRLPVHGQRTKTNSRTVRGNIRKTAGSGRKSASEKT